MGALLRIALQLAAAAAAGWAGSDIFNEVQTTEQAGGEPTVTVGKVIGVNWVTWLLAGLSVGLVTYLYLLIRRKQ